MSNLNKQVQVNITLKPAVGQNDVTVPFPLKKGFVKSMVAVTRGTEFLPVANEAITPAIFLGLKDDANGDIVPMSHIDLFKQTGGDYEKSFKPLNFDVNGENYNLRLLTDRVSTGVGTEDIEVFVTFFYDTKIK